MTQYKLSNEHFNNDIDFAFTEDLLRYGHYITNGEMVIDERTAEVRGNVVKNLKEWQYNASIEPIINEKRLKKVLDSKYYVETTPIALNNLFLAFNEKENIKVLMGAKYANMTDLLYIFYYEDVFYCFDLLNADEEAGVDEDAYMFVCAFMRVQARDNTASHIWELFEKYKELKCEID